WSSDVCSSDLFFASRDSVSARGGRRPTTALAHLAAPWSLRLYARCPDAVGRASRQPARADRATRAASTARGGHRHRRRIGRRAGTPGHRHRRRSGTSEPRLGGTHYRMIGMQIVQRPNTTKYIFVTGGVVSSLGKGIAAASLGRLLVERGLRVSMLKFDPYINVDPGTMSPFQHGEVFVTDDGAETDLDLGHYERFIDRAL